MEGPAEKRLRKCAVKRRKRDNPAAISQTRAFRKRRKLTPEARELINVMEDIKTHEEKLTLVATLMRQRLTPHNELSARVVRLERELFDARAQWQAAVPPDMRDLDERRAELNEKVRTLKAKALAIMQKSEAMPELPVDTSCYET
jgi:cell division protein ZapA (FtsZ GTPase activity inhibitor)